MLAVNSFGRGRNPDEAVKGLGRDVQARSRFVGNHAQAGPAGLKVIVSQTVPVA
jgi:hypothetical protein